MMRYIKKNMEGLAISILFAELVGISSSLISGNNSKDLYSRIALPPFSPPSWIFGVAWGILYALMGIAAYLVYNENKSKMRTQALGFYLAQLFVNFLWSIIFFRFELFWLSVVVIIILDILVLFMMSIFGKVNITAQKLMIPYFLWLLFATYLNIGVAILN